MKPNSQVKGYSPTMRTSSNTVALLSWEYDQADIMYDQVDLPYDGGYSYDILRPSSRLSSFSANTRIE